MNKETPHPKFGSKVRLINKPVWVGAYEEGETGVVVDQNALGFSATLGHVHVALDYGYNRIYSIPHGEYELMQDGVKGTHQEILNGNDVVLCINSAASATTAESLRNSILNIRSKREELQKEILQLDEQEKEAVEKLKEQGFVLYEGNVSKEPVITEKKDVLYAGDIKEDMTNCENWKNGDILRVTTNSDRWIPFGTLVKHADADGCMSPFTNSEYHDHRAISEYHLKFHSRPVK